MKGGDVEVVSFFAGTQSGCRNALSIRKNPYKIWFLERLVVGISDGHASSAWNDYLKCGRSLVAFFCGKMISPQIVTEKIVKKVIDKERAKRVYNLATHFEKVRRN